jgi:hypothetical protein
MHIVRVAAVLLLTHAIICVSVLLSTVTTSCKVIHLKSQCVHRSVIVLCVQLDVRVMQPIYKHVH